MKKSQQIKKDAKKATNCLVKVSDIDNYLGINEDDLEPSSDTTDYKSLLTQSFDISKTMVKNVSQVKASHNLFLLDTDKLGLSLKCKAFYKNFLDDQDFEINNYFNQELIELFDSKEIKNKEKFLEIQCKNLKANHDEIKSNENSKIPFNQTDTKEQNIEDWLDELID